jgi:hypothetical protein
VEIIDATVAGGGGSAARPVLQTRLAGGNPPDTWQSHPGWELLGQYVEPATARRSQISTKATDGIRLFQRVLSTSFSSQTRRKNVDFGWVSHPGTEGSFIIVAGGFTLAKGAPHKDASIG